jgi:hypothetical protein
MQLGRELATMLAALPERDWCGGAVAEFGNSIARLSPRA